MSKNELIEQIALTHFDHTLAVQRSDRLDFFEVSVWSVREALEAAYRAGQQSRPDNHAETGLRTAR
jgi:hypothetical protein